MLKSVRHSFGTAVLVYQKRSLFSLSNPSRFGFELGFVLIVSPRKGKLDEPLPILISQPTLFCNRVFALHLAALPSLRSNDTSPSHPSTPCAGHISPSQLASPSLLFFFHHDKCA
jgi:hypothetical protein